MNNATREEVEEVLDEQYEDYIFTVEDDVVWVSGMQSRCTDIAEKMALTLSKTHDIPTSLVHRDDAGMFGGVQFRWGENA